MSSSRPPLLYLSLFLVLFLALAFPHFSNSAILYFKIPSPDGTASLSFHPSSHWQSSQTSVPSSRSSYHLPFVTSIGKQLRPHRKQLSHPAGHFLVFIGLDCNQASVLKSFLNLLPWCLGHWILFWVCFPIFASPSFLPPCPPPNGNLEKVAFSFLTCRVLSLEDFIDFYLFLKAFQSYLFGFKCLPEFPALGKVLIFAGKSTLGNYFQYLKI